MGLFVRGLGGTFSNGGCIGMPHGGRVIGFIPFPRVLVLCEMKSVSSRI